MSLALRNEIGCNKVRMVLIDQMPLLPLVPKRRVRQKEAVKALAQEVVVAMVPVVRRGAMAARRTTIASTRLLPVALLPSFRAHGAGLLLLILNPLWALKKSSHQLNPRPLMGVPLSWLVKIAGQRLLRSGGEMSRGTPSVMLVVSLILLLLFL